MTDSSLDLKEQKYLRELVDRFYDACISTSDCKICDYHNKVKSEAIAKVADRAAPWAESSTLIIPDDRISRHIYEAGKACLNYTPATVLDELLQAREFINVYYKHKESEHEDKQMQEVLCLIASKRNEYVQAKTLNLDISKSLDWLEKARNELKAENYEQAKKYAIKANNSVENVLQEYTRRQVIKEVAKEADGDTNRTVKKVIDSERKKLPKSKP